ncbi:MAG TPA: class I SAM-dependent methyltransferase, partial [Casimicrobium sp.]|nr:class I SAM-dependent methyltransferase [Casimicrobium sp.]
MHNQETPSPWMQQHAHLVRPDASLLDVACGYGRHAKFFAARGIQVTAVDRDAAALASLAGVANVTTEMRDLENDPWPYAADSFDAVVVCNYLWRPTLATLLDCIRPRGVLLYETFMDGNEKYGKPSRPDFLLRPEELVTHVALDFEIVDFTQGLERTPDGKIFAVKQK